MDSLGSHHGAIIMSQEDAVNTGAFYCKSLDFPLESRVILDFTNL